MNDLNKFAQDCHNISASKGWTALKRTDTQLCNLMISECVEALEDFRNNKGINETYYEVKLINESGVSYSDILHELPEGADRSKCKPCGIPTELADFIIRCGQFFGTNELNLSAAVDFAEGTLIDPDFNEMLADTMQCISLGRLASPEKGIDKDRQSMSNYLGEAFYIVSQFCEQNKIDLWKAVKEKNEYNATRPHLHGGKKI